jgi:hypothetical protein
VTAELPPPQVPLAAADGRGPHRNRVTPLGEIVAIPLRGAWLGNRGMLHSGTDVVRSHAGKAWITCALHYKDWRLPQWAAHHYTILFFHDEAVALAAGHRPCALCRRPAYRAFRDAGWPTATPFSAKDLDRTLHDQRLLAGTHRRRVHPRDWSALPDGAFVLDDSRPSLVLGPSLIEWTVLGYVASRPRPTHGEATVITPPLSLGALNAGYPVQIDGAATQLARDQARSTTVSRPTARAPEAGRRGPNPTRSPAAVSAPPPASASRRR